MALSPREKSRAMTAAAVQAPLHLGRFPLVRMHVMRGVAAP
jgi:hypothetical protein